MINEISQPVYNLHFFYSEMKFSQVLFDYFVIQKLQEKIKNLLWFGFIFILIIGRRSSQSGDLVDNSQSGQLI